MTTRHELIELPSERAAAPARPAATPAVSAAVPARRDGNVAALAGPGTGGPDAAA